jgi:hypothetical protein
MVRTGYTGVPWGKNKTNMTWLNEKQARKLPQGCVVAWRIKDKWGPFYYHIDEYFCADRIGDYYSAGAEFLRLDGPERKGKK